jgi:hypothetical protein
MSKAKETAITILEAAKKEGFSVEVRGEILTISKTFTPGDKDAFVSCDMMYSTVLDKLPQTSAGSTWGTDGGGVGGMVAINNGHFKMNKSGGSKTVLKSLAKLING